MPTLPSSRTALTALTALTACVTGNPPQPEGDGPDGGGEVPLEGGSYVFPTCGTTLTTRLGASAPLAGTAVLGEAPTPRHVHLGLVDDPRTSMVVQWRTSDVTTLASTVQYGKAAVSESSTTGATFVYQAGFNGSGDLVRMHEAHLCGLEPDTEYVYRVGGVGTGGAEAWSPEFRFRTAPDLAADPSAEVTFMLIGDSRGGYDTWRSLLELADTIAAPDVILFSGDAVTVGQVQEEWDAFFDGASGHLERVPIVSTHGNHDTNSVNYYSLFAMPGDEQHFGFDYGPVHFTVLNDSPEDSADLTTKLPDFLRQDLMSEAAQQAAWKFVMHHRPAWSAATNHGSDVLLQSTLGPLIDEHHVDLVLNGHDHDYERTHPLADGQVRASPSEGTIYVVAGGAGASLYGAGQGFWTAVSESTHHLVLILVRQGQLTLRAYRDDGSLLDELTIKKE